MAVTRDVTVEGTVVVPALSVVLKVVTVVVTLVGMVVVPVRVVKLTWKFVLVAVKTVDTTDVVTFDRMNVKVKFVGP